MEKHITAVGVLQIGLGVLGLLGTCLLVFLFGGTTAMLTQLEVESFVPTIVAIFGGGFALIVLLTSLPQVIGGAALLMYKNWGRYLVLVISVLELFNIPIGTAVGGYSIWVLVQDETVELFDRGS